MAEPPPENTPLLDGLRVLLADDHQDSRDVVAEFLQHHGAEVVGVGTTEEALAALGKSRFDALVSDLRLPELSGYGLVKKVRSWGEDGTLPAIAITAYPVEEDKNKALEAGFDDYLPKTSSLMLVRKIARLKGREPDLDR
ncbi:MAG TPA: response regulator [Vicinamibacteria bacterium]|nr:response regulator [Vicinamibacteria bacterium]